MEIRFHSGPPGNREKTRPITDRTTRIKGRTVQGLEIASESSFLLIAGSDMLPLIVGIPVLLKHGFHLTIFVLVLDVDFSSGVAEQPSNMLRDNDASMMAGGAKYTDRSLTFAFPVTLSHELHDMGDYFGGQRVFKNLLLNCRIGPSELSKGAVLLRISDTAAIHYKGQTLGNPVLDAEANQVDFHIGISKWCFRGPHTCSRIVRMARE